jgi:hypothetical protein
MKRTQRAAPPRASESHRAAAVFEPLEARELLAATTTTTTTTTTTGTSYTVVSLSASSNFFGTPNASLGEHVTVTVTVRGHHGAVRGGVELLDNGAPLTAAGQAIELPLSGGKARYTFEAGNISLAVGSHSIGALFSGDAKLTKSYANAVPLMITQPTLTANADGLQVATITAGNSKLPAAAAGNTVVVQYTAFLASNGRVYDYTASHGGGSNPSFQFTLGANPLQVVQGFDEGVTGMLPGEERLLSVPAALGYGAKGFGSVPPNANLIYLVKLLKVS